MTERSIYQRLLAVQEAVDSIPKKGYNAFHKYHYATEADILSIKGVLNANGLIVLPTTEAEETGFREGGKCWAKVTMRFRVINAEKPEEVIESVFTGYAEDSNDKAIYKATTGANKYFYLKFFGVATDDDPENETAPAPKPQQRQGYGKKSAPAPAPDARTQALVYANKILALQKQHGLSNNEVLQVAGIESIRDLAEVGQVDALANAYHRLQDHMRQRA